VAHSAGPSPATIALLAAGRGEVFSQMFSVSAAGEVKAVDQPSHISPARLLEKYGGLRNVIWAGQGAHLQRALLEDYAKAHGLTLTVNSETDERESAWKLAPEVTNLARDVAAISIARFASGLVETPHALSAIYVRPSDAELKQTCL